MIDYGLQKKAESLADFLKSEIQYSIAAIPDIEITEVPIKDVSVAVFRSPNKNTFEHSAIQNPFEVEDFIVEINRIAFRFHQDIEQMLFNNRIFKQLAMASKAIPAKLTNELSVFKNSLPSENNVKLHLVLPEEALEIFTYQDSCSMNYVFDMVFRFGAYAEIDGKILSYRCESSECFEPSLIVADEAETDAAISELVDIFLGRT